MLITFSDTLDLLHLNILKTCQEALHCSGMVSRKIFKACHSVFFIVYFTPLWKITKGLIGYIQFNSISELENNIIFVEFAILHHILKKLIIRYFNISFNSKTAMIAQQMQPSNSAGILIVIVHITTELMNPQMTQILFKSGNQMNP